LSPEEFQESGKKGRGKEEKGRGRFNFKVHHLS
jgi:hypothetical protein